MNIDPIPVWIFFQIPDDAVDICIKLAQSKTNAEEGSYWERAASLLSKVKSTTVDELTERDFDWMIKLRVQFETDEEIAKLRSNQINLKNEK